MKEGSLLAIGFASARSAMRSESFRAITKITPNKRSLQILAQNGKYYA
ncbi:MAG: hypothetical protein WBM44_16395 [Waterburya sp.]